MPASAPAARLGAAERRAAIVRAALPLFARHGYDGVTTRQLADAAGISEALVFRHFPSKLSLFQAIYDDLAHQFELDYERIRQLEPGAASLVRLVYFLTRSILIKRAAHADDSLRLLYRSFVEDGEFGQLVLGGAKISLLRRVFGACLEAARVHGDVDVAPESSANLFWFAHHVASAACLFRLPGRPGVRYEGDLESVIAQITAFAVRGLGLTRRAEARLVRRDLFTSWLADPGLSLLRPL